MILRQQKEFKSFICEYPGKGSTLDQKSMAYEKILNT